MLLKKKKISELKDHINKYKLSGNSSTINNQIKALYKGVNYGFHFNDLVITNDGKNKLLVLQKIELDESYVPCPDCFETILRGNSYPKMLYRSFECQNPCCPSRSKLGRGKRFDYYSVKRNNKLLNNKEDYIPQTLRYKFRKDIVENDVDFLEFAIKFYTWSNNHIAIISDEVEHQLTSIYRRDIKHMRLNEWSTKNYKDFFELSIYKLLETLKNNVIIDEVKENSEKNVNKLIKTINADSTKYLANSDFKEKFNCVITSPPYFNAREYSSWNNLYIYLIDMMLNARSVISKMDSNGIYAYNIGDIVDKDKIYVNSNMSKKRQMPGFYSMLIFYLVGCNVLGNDIWYKGEVQSKRNSSNNSFPGFLKPINCYEHIIYLSPDCKKSIKTEVFKIDTVKKINSRGENKYGHTAPYPEELVRVIINKIKDYLKLKLKILDPFLGSGTTLIVANRYSMQAWGIEMNKKYYDLSIDRINNDFANLKFNL
ncbi:DNA methyltransferase [Staphylococcus pettenkoferi]|uniref:DNA methyltransferase n=1 Tax=Staphylococcus pettenkoferi TaxID=170573 RepID=UPI0011A36C51|nr:DNA methyltransferase [Staphylococcus pettenkoferi]